jgi:hypothetical protein
MKTKKRSRDAAAPAPTWTREEHESRARDTRAATFLSHDTKHKRSELKVKLHRTRLERSIESMKARLQSWDAVQEAKDKQAAEAAAKAKELEDASTAPKKKRGRLGPETWKLRGAARPANEVYDFDVRYVDPHLKAHETAREKAQRTVNLLALAKNHSEKKSESSKFSFVEQAGDVGREYLALLMQLGHLGQEMKHFKTARASFLECMELDTDVITTAREDLMRMYTKLGRTEAALRLGQRLEDDRSVWIRYSHALVSVQTKQEDAEQQMVRAIQANSFCAYYLAFHDTFCSVMEYTDELEEADDVPQSSLEEAIEYCVSEASQQWKESGAAEKLRQLLLQAKKGNHQDLQQSAVEWSERLEMIESEYDARMGASSEPVETEADAVSGEDVDAAVVDDESPGTATDSEEGEDDEEPPVDVRMYAGMFRTAMEMLQEAGSF